MVSRLIHLHMEIDSLKNVNIIITIVLLKISKLLFIRICCTVDTREEQSLR